MAGFASVFSLLKTPVRLVTRMGRKTKKTISDLENDMWAIE
jgi:hypothetical protein